ncbi:hypothetical protein A9Y87_11310 [Salmonella enterica subsp. enterica]|nr:hypothetical protein A9Y87_11310 [Salmonella enterica subsp. enterica]
MTSEIKKGEVIPHPCSLFSGPIAIALSGNPVVAEYHNQPLNTLPAPGSKPLQRFFTVQTRGAAKALAPGITYHH